MRWMRLVAGSSEEGFDCLMMRVFHIVTPEEQNIKVSSAAGAA